MSTQAYISKDYSYTYPILLESLFFFLDETHLDIHTCITAKKSSLLVGLYAHLLNIFFWLVEMAISTNQKPTIYRNLCENTGPDLQILLALVGSLRSTVHFLSVLYGRRFHLPSLSDTWGERGGPRGVPIFNIQIKCQSWQYAFYLLNKILSCTIERWNESSILMRFKKWFTFYAA